MKRIVFLTSAFPYFPGEQFIEDEIAYWGATSGVRLVVLPARAEGSARLVPDSVGVDLSISVTFPLLVKLAYAFTGLFSGLFWRDIRLLYSSERLNIQTVISLLSVLMRTLRAKTLLEKYIDRAGTIETLYCYWNEAYAYAGVLLKRQGKILKLVSRAHGVDLYEERWPYLYMPLKRQFVSEMDAVFPVSDQGARYYRSTYGIDPTRVSISRLGVCIPGAISQPSPAGMFSVASVAFCVALKRIDKIIQAIEILSRNNPELVIEWTHIGDGPLFEALRASALEKLGPLNNVRFLFAGFLDNAEVRKFYLSKPIDVFINASESEGIPVSIMEAMSAGVPVIAPAIGGIGELVSNTCGALLGSNPTADDISAAMQVFLSKTDTKASRDAARAIVVERFNAATNYSQFIQRVAQL